MKKRYFLDFIFHFFILQFIVVKFLSTDNDEDDYYEVALSKWLKNLDENMIGNSGHKIILQQER